MRTAEEYQKTIDELIETNIQIMETKDVDSLVIKTYLPIMRELEERNKQLNIELNRAKSLAIDLAVAKDNLMVEKQKSEHFSKKSYELQKKLTEMERKQDELSFSSSEYKRLEKYYNFLCEYFDVDHDTIKEAYERRDNQDDNWSEF